MATDLPIQTECDQIHSKVEALLPTVTSDKVLQYPSLRSRFWGGYFLGLSGALASIVVVFSVAPHVSQALSMLPLSHGAAPEVAMRVGSGFVRPSRAAGVASSSGATVKAGTPLPHAAASTGSGVQPSLEQLRELVRSRGGKGVLSILRRPDVAPLGVSETEPVRADNKIGTYLSAGSMGRDAFVQSTIDDTLAAGGDAIVFEVKGGNVYFHAAAPMAQQLGTITPTFDLPAAVAAFKARGLYTIARFVSVKDEPLATAMPSTQIRNPVSGQSVGSVWTDPGAPDTIEYNRQILVDLLNGGIDEVNLDYIRYPSEYAMASIGLDGTQKADHIEAFLKMARDTINSVRPQTKLGISTYAILGWDFKINEEAIGQDFVRFAPLVDIISPMAYPSSFTSPEYYVPGRNVGSREYSLVSRTLKGYDDLLGSEQSQKVRPWLQAYYFTSDQIHDEIRAVYDTGHCGFTFWNANNNYGPAYEGMKKALADRPERCK